MSGPKVSYYELSAWERKNVDTQRECQLQIMIAAGKLGRLTENFNYDRFDSKVESALNSHTFLSMSDSNISPESDEISWLSRVLSDIRLISLSLGELKSKVSTLCKGKMTVSEDALNEKQSYLTKLQSLLEIALRINEQLPDVEQVLSKILERGQHDFQEKKSEIIANVVAVSSFHIDPDENDDDHFASRKKKIEDKLYSLYVSNKCPSLIKAEILEAFSSLAQISQIEFLKTFEAITLRPLMERYDKSLAFQQEEKELYDEVNARYSALCSILQIPTKEYSQDNAGIESLTSEIAILEKQAVLQVEQEFISDCMNKAMLEMGYELIGDRSVTKRSGKRFTNELFSFNDGTAINVTYDSEGQIAMELGGLDRQDRIPTAEEGEALCEDMKTFCSDFTAIEKKLESMGVIVKSRVSLSPPDAQHATIINVDDYNIKTSKPIGELVITNKRKRRIHRQAQHKERN